MANHTARRKACFSVEPSAVAHTFEVAALTTPPLPHRGSRFIILFLSVCVQCLSSALVFTFYAALQVDCWAWPPLTGSRSTRESLLNRDVAFAAMRPSVGSSTILPFSKDETSRIDSMNAWLPTQSESLRAVKVHQPRQAYLDNPVNQVKKDGESSFEFPLYLDNIEGRSKTSTVRPESEALADDFSASFDRDRPAKLQESEQEAGWHNQKSEANLNTSLERFYAAKLRKAVSKAPLRKDARSSFSSFTLDLINATEPRTEAPKESPQRRYGEGEFNFSLDGETGTKPKEAARGLLPRVAELQDDFLLSSRVDDEAPPTEESSNAPPRKKETGAEFMNDAVVVEKEVSEIPSEEKSEGGFNFFLDEEEKGANSTRAVLEQLPQKVKTEQDLNFSLEAGDGADPRKEKTGADFDESSRLSNPAALRKKASTRIFPTEETEHNFNVFPRGEVEEEGAESRRPAWQQPPREVKGGEDFSFPVEAGDVAVPGKAAENAPSLEEKTGNNNLFARSNYWGIPRKEKWEKPSTEDYTKGDFNFSLGEQGGTSRRTLNFLPRKLKEEEDFGFSSKAGDEGLRGKAASIAPLQKEETGIDLNVSSRSNNAATRKRKAANDLHPEDKSEGEFNFFLDDDEAEEAKPKRTPSKSPPRKVKTEDDLNLKPKADKRTKRETTTPKGHPQKAKPEEDLNFSLDEDPGKKQKKALSEGSHSNEDAENDFDFSFDLGSAKQPKKSAAVTDGSEDDTDVYTLLDEEEEDEEEEDGKDKGKSNLDASSAKPEARFKLKERSERKREMRSTLEKAPPAKRKKIQEDSIENRIRDLPGTALPTDAWRTMNTTASSADFVKSLEAERSRQREARRALEEKLLNAPPVENMYTRAVKTVPATHYLGVGYDAVKGNPLGDPTMMADPGLRSPIMAFTFEQSRYGVTNDLSTLQPLGAYTRPFAACRQSETVSELNTLDDYQKELSVDASMEGGDALGLNRFSGSGGYQSFAKELSSKDTKSYLLRTYCIRYEAGLAQTPSFNWNYTMAFQDAVNHLPTGFDGESEDTPCSVAQWRQDSTVDACENTNIPIWMDFIQQFGTHYIVRLFAGGKMTYQVSMKSSDIRKLKTKGVDVKSELKVMIGGFGGEAAAATKSRTESASNITSLDIEKETLVIGGRPPGNVSDPAAMAQWSESVEEMPMPVKVELQSLEGLLPKENKAAFRKAAKYYGKAYGMSVQDLQALELAPKELPEILRSATQVAWAGPPPGFAKCPIDTVVLFGYAVKLNFNRGKRNDLASYRLVACAAGREKCDGVGNVDDEDDDERIFVACGKETLNDLYQVVAESPHEGERLAVATCPEEAVIILGFGLAISSGHDGAQHVEVESCRKGQTICTKSVGAETQKSFVWTVCAEKNYPGIKDLHNVARIDSKGPTSKRAKNSDGLVTISCPTDESILLGFAMEAHTHMPEVRETFTTCDKGKPTCSLQGAGVDKAIFGVDHHSLFGWAVCSPDQKEAAHAITENPEKGGKYETTGSQGHLPKRVETRTG